MECGLVPGGSLLNWTYLQCEETGLLHERTLLMASGQEIEVQHEDLLRQIVALNDPLGAGTSQDLIRVLK